MLPCSELLYSGYLANQVLIIACNSCVPALADMYVMLVHFIAALVCNNWHDSGHVVVALVSGVLIAVLLIRAMKGSC